MSRARGRAAALSVAALLIHSVLDAQSESTADRWRRQLAETRQLLLAGRWAEAEPASRMLLEELMADLKGGPQAADLVAVGLAQIALAEAGVGRERDARWHIRSAEIFNPALASTPLATEFGAVGARLDEWRAMPTLKSTGLPPATDSTIAGLYPPRIVAGNFIVLRASVEQRRLLDPESLVAFAIDDQGLPAEPAIHGRLDNPAPLLLSLEVLREFRFEPARYRDQPVAVLWELPLPLTQSVLRKALWELKRSSIDSLLRGERWQEALDEAEALESALARGTGDAVIAKQTIVAYYISRARAGLAATEPDS